MPDWWPFSFDMGNETSTAQAPAVAAPAPAPTAEVKLDTSGGQAPQSTAAAPAAGGVDVASGAFIGQNGHLTRGRVRVATVGGGWVLRFHDDFYLDGSCAVTIHLGIRGADPAASIGPVQSNRGAQSYQAPAGIDVQSYKQVWLTCDNGQPIGRAELTPL